jgi:hypothetical protein
VPFNTQCHPKNQRKWMIMEWSRSNNRVVQSRMCGESR